MNLKKESRKPTALIDLGFVLSMSKQLKTIISFEKVKYLISHKRNSLFLSTSLLELDRLHVPGGKEYFAIIKQILEKKWNNVSR